MARKPVRRRATTPARVATRSRTATSTARAPQVSNKFRYYRVTTTKVVRALNKADALALSNGRRGVSGEVLADEIKSDRLTSASAKKFAARSN